ncbi:dTDP-Rha:alpha-D-GlcNAc-pyrophosphate polyprenol, alpha-3-L-rhamnosyltransferase [Bacteroidales bacterium Barb6]|nr:dTDP-Rha:alpha-D-GlcNAc-pyrophosphate polyprenol, alpha-3-L-rhamnosyltransferase [Bacteroidales bacterium Barb6]
MTVIPSVRALIWADSLIPAIRADGIIVRLVSPFAIWAGIPNAAFLSIAVSKFAVSVLSSLAKADGIVRFLFPLKSPGSATFNKTGKPMNTVWILGADFMVKKSVLDKTGGFDPRFFLDYEEVDLCRRIRNAGYKIVSVPEAEIIHLEGKAPCISKTRFYYNQQSMYKYYAKVYDVNPVIAYDILRLKSALRILMFSVMLNKRKVKYWKDKRAAQKKAFDELH